MLTSGIRCTDLSSRGFYSVLASRRRDISPKLAAQPSGRRGPVLHINSKSNVQKRNRLVNRACVGIRNHSFSSNIESVGHELEEEERLGFIKAGEEVFAEQRRFSSGRPKLERELFVGALGLNDRDLYLDEGLEHSPINYNHDATSGDEGPEFSEQKLDLFTASRHQSDRIWDRVEDQGYRLSKDSPEPKVPDLEVESVDFDGQKSQGSRPRNADDVIHHIRHRPQLEGENEQYEMVDSDLSSSSDMQLSIRQRDTMEISSNQGPELFSFEDEDGVEPHATEHWQSQKTDRVEYQMKDLRPERRGLLLGRQVFLSGEKFYQRWIPKGSDEDLLQVSSKELSSQNSDETESQHVDVDGELEVTSKAEDGKDEVPDTTDNGALDVHDQLANFSLHTIDTSAKNGKDLFYEFLKRRTGNWNGKDDAATEKNECGSVLDSGRVGIVRSLPIDVRNPALVIQDRISVCDDDNNSDDRLICNIVKIVSNLPQNSSLEDHLTNIGEGITTSIGNGVLTALGEACQLWRFLSFFQWLRTRDPCLLDSRSFCSLFTFLGRQKLPDKALIYYQNMPAESNFHCVQVYNSLLGALAKSGRTEKIETILQEMKHRNIEQDAATCSILITASQGKGRDRLQKVWTMFEDSMKDGVRPSVVLYGSLIKALCDEEHVKQAMQVSLSMEKIGILPNVVIYNTLIDGHCKCLQFEEAEGLFLEMKERGLNPSLATYNALINGYGRNGQPEVSEELLFEMQTEGLGPDVVTYTSLISAYGKKRMTEKAKDAFLRMKKEGILPTSHTYTALINAYAEGGWHEKAQTVFDNMIKEKFKPTIQAYTALLDGYKRAGHLGMVKHIWNTIKEDGCEMTRITYRTTMDAFSKHGLYAEARDVMYVFRQRGLEPDTMIFNMLLNAYARGGVTSKLPKLLMEMEEAGCEADAYTYCTLIYACIRLRDFTQAFEFDRIMMEKGKLPDPATYSKMRKILRIKYDQKEENDEKSDASNHPGSKSNYRKLKNPQRLKRFKKKPRLNGRWHKTEKEKPIWKPSFTR